MIIFQSFRVSQYRLISAQEVRVASLTSSPFSSAEQNCSTRENLVKV